MTYILFFFLKILDNYLLLRNKKKGIVSIGTLVHFSCFTLDIIPKGYRRHIFKSCFLSLYIKVVYLSFCKNNLLFFYLNLIFLNTKTELTENPDTLFVLEFLNMQPRRRRRGFERSPRMRKVGCSSPSRDKPMSLN